MSWRKTAALDAGNVKRRLDHALVELGLAPTRSQARDLVKRGCVRVAGETVTKPGLVVGPGHAIQVAPGAQPFVSRGGMKLAAALAEFSFSPADRVALDIGASTGGFTQVLLVGGARRVHAIDVGSNQLSPILAADARVVSREGFDARALTRAEIPEPLGAIVADASFISLTQVLGPALALAARDAWLVALIKPQFEVGRGDIGSGGIVRSDVARQHAIERVRDWLTLLTGWSVTGVIPSPIAGGGGNAEFLIGARRDD